LVGLVALLARLAVVLSGPSLESGDMAGWEETARRVTLAGVHAGYASLDPGSLYPPAFLYPLWAIGHVYRACCSPDFVTDTRMLDALMRLGPILADALLAVLVCRLARTWADPDQARWAGLLYAMCPAVLVTVAQRGMIGDPYVGVLVIVALLAALRGWGCLSGVCMALAALTKPQGLALVPLLAILLTTRTPRREQLAALGAVTLTTAAVLLPFALNGTLPQVQAALSTMAGLHAYTQNSADNLWTLLPVWRWAGVSAGPFGQVPDGMPLLPGLSYRDAGLLAGAALQVTVLVRLGRAASPQAVAEAGATLAVGFFFLSTRMHVNYVFLGLPFLCALAPKGGLRLRLVLVAVTFACLVDWQDTLPWAAHRANAVLYAASLATLGCGGMRLTVPSLRPFRLPTLARQRLAWWRWASRRRAEAVPPHPGTARSLFGPGRAPAGKHTAWPPVTWQRLGLRHDPADGGPDRALRARFRDRVLARSTRSAAECEQYNPH
jgi:hypothetical protein